MNTSDSSVLQLQTLLLENEALSRALAEASDELASLEALSYRLCERLKASAPDRLTRAAAPAQTEALNMQSILDAIQENFRLRAKLAYCQTVIDGIETRLLDLSDLLASR